MRQDGYVQKDLEDTYAYLYLDNWHKVFEKKIVESLNHIHCVPKKRVLFKVKC